MTTLDTHKYSIRPEFKAFLQLAMPLASAQVAQLATGFVDTVMMGHLGREALAAGALASITFFACLTTISGVVMGVSPLVAEAFGAGDKTRIEEVTRQGLWLSLLLTIPVMIALSNLDRFMGQLGQTETTVQLANAYLDIVLWGLFPALGFAMFRGVVSALSQARPIMIIVTAGTVFNILANYALGLGKFGFPRLELSGLALGSALTLWGMFLALIIYLSKHQQFRTYRFFHHLRTLKLRVLWELLKFGVPIGIFYALEIGVYMVVSYLIGTLGTNELATHQIGFQTTNLIFMVPLGMSFAATARVGQWLGRQNSAGIRRAGFTSIISGAGWTAVVSVLLFIFPRQVIGFYIDISASENQAIVSFAISMLRIAAFSHFFDGVQKVAYGALQGLQDTRIPTVFSFLSYWCIGLTSGYWLAFKQGLGSIGFWIGLLIAVMISAMFFVWRFQRFTSNQSRLKFFI